MADGQSPGDRRRRRARGHRGAGGTCGRPVYDPWGLELAGIGYIAPGNAENDFKFQGKELAGDFGLGWYDFMWRQYDPVLGRSTSVDPLAHQMRRVSPFAFVFNNPLRFIDPDGMKPVQTDPLSEAVKKGQRSKTFVDLLKKAGIDNQNFKSEIALGNATVTNPTTGKITIGWEKPLHLGTLRLIDTPALPAQPLKN
jgi:RHS repeat-associated protein